ncbi:hypothetical protein [Nocardioides sp. TF02-7]|uniref:hypothetical protein n=1 Tax=Nocardioides sp. TF02-7 TaxID=2917724 RepID=UPI001F070283|nr:hypothetical protein [Nocardioides sp. TF02-7]UMG92798.1 hypothetical protein MF408_24430 [Nocardioides sp. TF02-7]
MPVLRRRRRVRPVADTDGRAASPVPWIGMVLVVSAFFLYAASGVVAPWWGTVLMVLVWLALFALGCSWWSRHPPPSPRRGCRGVPALVRPAARRRAAARLGDVRNRGSARAGVPRGALSSPRVARPSQTGQGRPAPTDAP